MIYASDCIKFLQQLLFFLSCDMQLLSLLFIGFLQFSDAQTRFGPGQGGNDNSCAFKCPNGAHPTLR